MAKSRRGTARWRRVRRREVWPDPEGLGCGRCLRNRIPVFRQEERRRDPRPRRPDHGLEVVRPRSCLLIQSDVLRSCFGGSSLVGSNGSSNRPPTAPLPWASAVKIAQRAQAMPRFATIPNIYLSISFASKSACSSSSGGASTVIRASCTSSGTYK
jgi:hypothetical protein